MKLKNNFTYNYENSGVTEAEISEISASLKDYMSELKSVRSTNDYSKPEGSINLPFDKSMHKEIERVCEKFNPDQLKYIFVIGIGGSSLGSKVFFDRNLNKYPQVVFFESISEWKANYYSDKLVLSDDIQSNEDFLFLLISKSGTTTETLVNFENIVSKENKFGMSLGKGELEDRMLIISDADSKLTFLAKDRNIAHLEIPKNVGGRFSFFSAVGMALAYLKTKNLEDFVSDASDTVTKYVTTAHDLENNPVVKSAAIKFLQYQKGYKINNLFFFSENENLGKWLRQLYAESLGKKFDLEGKEVNSGFLPIVSIGSDDLHSILQYYFSTNQKIFTTFFASINEEVSTERESFLGNLASFYEHNSVSKIENSIYQAIKTEYMKRGLPFEELLDISNVALMQFKMIETMLLGKLMNINTFDQPEVEGYKIQVNRLLGN